MPCASTASATARVVSVMVSTMHCARFMKPPLRIVTALGAT
jgi:hypothetical protein